MLIFIYGDDSYSAQKKLNVMRSAFKDKFDAAGMNISEFEGKKIKLGDVLQSVKTPPFISDKRMVIVSGLLSAVTRKPDAKPWIESLESVPESTIMIIFDALGSKKVEKNELFKQLSKLDGAHAYHFPALTGSALNQWAVNEVRALELNIDSRFLQQVIAMVGSDLWQLSSEFKKLAAYANGRQVDQGMITLFVKANFDDQMFAFIDACSQKQKPQAMSLLQQQRMSGATDVYLFSMLARQIRLLIGARSILDKNSGATKQDVANELGVHPFVAQKTLSQARGFSASALALLHDLLFSLDGSVKRGGASWSIAVDRIVAEMLS
jgi:DNA polymerase III subunit delta